jgi:hypothetical protein
MKIVEETPARLVLDDRPWLLGGLIAAAIVILAGFGLFRLSQGGEGGIAALLGAAGFGIAFAIFVRRVEAVFDRASGELVVRTSTIRGRSEARRPLAEIASAEVETRESSRGRRRRRREPMRVHRPMLRLSSGGALVPLNPMFAAGDAAREAADAVNRWIAGSRIETRRGKQ